MKTSLLLIALVLLGCGTAQQPATTQHSGDEELDFVVSVLGREYKEHFASDSTLLIHGEFLSGAHMLFEAPDSLSQDLVQDYVAKSTARQEVWPELATRLPVVILTPAALDSIFSNGDMPNQDVEAQLRLRYPRSRPEILLLTRVGFSPDRDLALWYAGSSSQGALCVYRKTASLWVLEGPVFVHTHL